MPASVTPSAYRNRLAATVLNVPVTARTLASLEAIRSRAGGSPELLASLVLDSLAPHLGEIIASGACDDILPPTPAPKPIPAELADVT